MLALTRRVFPLLICCFLLAVPLIIMVYDVAHGRANGSLLDNFSTLPRVYETREYFILYSIMAAFLGLNALVAYGYRTLAKRELAESSARQAQEQLQLRLAEKERVEKQMQAYTDRIEESRADITAAKRNLEMESRKLKAILDHMSEGILTINAQGEIKSMNVAAQNVFGYADDEVIGQSLLTLLPPPPETASTAYLDECLNAHFQDPSEIQRERQGQRKNGARFPLIMGVNKIKVDDELLHVALVRDVTKQKERENELHDAKNRAEAASKTKSDFLANMSHELRTPLNSILGMTRMLRDSDLQGEQRSMLDTVFAASGNLLEIVNDILDLSKIEAGEMTLEHIGFDMRYLLHSVTNTLEPIARDKNLALIRAYEEEGIPFLMGDPTRIGRILTNLIGNAIKYTEKGKVEVRAFCRALNVGRVELRCEVMDSGIGIAPDKQDRIFEKFVQADSSTTRKYGGTGLGLAITKQLIEMMGGRIGVSSVLGQGSTFWIEIPFETTTKLHEEKQIRRQKMRMGTLPPDKTRVLIAEDHHMNQALIRKLLARIGLANIRIVENGLIALNLLKTEPWDLVLMDCHMPEKNGYETTRELRDWERHLGRHVPVIAMTANAMVGDKEKCLCAGMDEYISKPLNPDELREVMGQWIAFRDSDITDATFGSPVDMTAFNIAPKQRPPASR